MALKITCESDAPFGSEPTGGREQCGLRYLKKARSGSREFHTERIAVEKAHGANYKVSAGLENRKADDDRSCLTS